MAGDRIFNMQPGAIYNDIHDNEMVIVPTSVEEAQALIKQHETTTRHRNDYHVTPYENDYAALVEWLAQEKAAGRDWYRLNNCNRSAMCRQLTEVLGWVVDQNSLQKHQNRQK